MSFDAFFTQMSKRWVMVFVLMFTAFLFIFVDKPLALYLHQLDLRQIKAIYLLTKLGIGGLYFVGLFSLVLFFRYIYPHKLNESRVFFLWLCAIIPSCFTLVVKMCFGRARPDVLFDMGGYGFYWLQTNAKFWSFPSGHTTTSMGFCFGLWVLFPRYRYLWMFLGLSIAMSRVLLTQHYLSDVLIAAYLSLLLVGLTTCFLKQKGYLAVALQPKIDA